MPPVKREREEYERYESDQGDEEDGYGSDDAADEGQNVDNDEGNEPLNIFGGLAKRVDFYPKGAIKQVRLHDFMTYNGTVSYRPGPRLNLVLGPNGTGKSSFVCGLCIGLNGSPKVLGRADNLKEFVRRGASSFWTEITLSSGGVGRDHVVRRTVTTRRERTAEGGHQVRYDSKWAINGCDVPAREVDRLIKELNIQFDNLCQFLPQDKVVEFAKMNQYETLAATQKALGDSSLYNQHQQLIKLRNDEKQVVAERTTSANRLSKLQADQERQRHDFERFQQREKLLQEARSLRSQSKWLEVYAKSKAAEAAKKRLQEKRAELRALEDQEEEDKGPIRAKEDLIARLKQQRASQERQAREADARMRQLGKQMEKRDEDVAALTEELSSLDQQSKKRAADIAAARQKLAAAEAEHANAPDRPPQSLNDRYQELRTKILESRREVSELELSHNDMASRNQILYTELGRLRGRLSLLESRKHQLLQNLGSIAANRNILALHQWIEQHKGDGTFHGPVIGPVALELNVSTVPGLPHDMALQYVENVCWQWLASYIVTCKEDEVKLNEEAKRLGVGYGVKAVASTADLDAPYARRYPSGPASQHARFGIAHTVDELIHAPPTVMRFLETQCKTTSVYIGNGDAAAGMSDLAQETSVGTVLVGVSKFSVLRSRYANARSIEERELMAGKLLGACSNSEEDAERAALKEQERRINEERERLQGSMTEVQRKVQEREQQQQAWSAEFDNICARSQAILQKRTTLAANVETARRQLAHKEAQPDPEQRRPQLRKNIEDKMHAHASLCRQLLVEAQVAWEAMREVYLLEFRAKEAKAQLDVLERSSKERERVLSAARAAVNNADQAFAALKAEMMRAKELAQENYPLEESDKEEVKRHDAASTPPASLLSQADEKEREAEQVVCHNQNVATEFRRRQTEIANLTQTVQQYDHDLQQLRQEMTNVKELWLPEIRKMVETINESFSTNFKEIGYAGQVRLHEEDDFDKFSIEILVQFRAQEGMQLLTANRQSGGERSVSTILYLIALQGVTDTPFRVVDEINQGMDPINERKVFQQLVSASTEEHTPQCFLLTPKLLLDLVYGKNVQVIDIFSGQNIDENLAKTFKMGHGHNNGSSFFGRRGEPLLMQSVQS